MFNVVLVEPEIPPNTGNIIRLCANTGCKLHLVHPLGFSLDEKQLRRAGLDYGDMTTVVEYDSWAGFTAERKSQSEDGQLLALSTRGTKDYHLHDYQTDDWLLFGSETKGLGEERLTQFSDQQVLRLPMVSESRSLNLSNTVAVVVYEAWRQNGFVVR